ncbi:Uncharacterised protein [Streptococcus pyogenes]|uniref:Uncharacterized protein n=1 Tax=Streptococcus canis TaxID=1329 RepID=A0AAE4TJ29_STRCB|nr:MULTISPECIES: hypothetical protein [Streptococcus]HEL1012797.1 hypothetical protein [Streptococcus equi subsp. ruminatorum]MDV5976789.1 hypothetical protein [Streptococcus canis]VGZ83152.1 Uncharacterised protein [Streptococcus pyogenes]VTS48941.1 Uncharacterised protein [Streptococcus dysgalactiae subsp. equisimilis]VTS50053.1 Uncharacterised protein [Streptococcus dysgalactiae subsp. equisimilis]
MLASFKKQNYVKSFLIGMTALTLPTFFTNTGIPKIKSEKLSDGQKVSADYSRSLEGIKEEVNYFEQEK